MRSSAATFARCSGSANAAPASCHKLCIESRCCQHASACNRAHRGGAAMTPKRIARAGAGQSALLTGLLPAVNSVLVYNRHCGALWPDKHTKQGHIQNVSSFIASGYGGTGCSTRAGAHVLVTWVAVVTGAAQPPAAMALAAQPARPQARQRRIRLP